MRGAQRLERGHIGGIAGGRCKLVDSAGPGLTDGPVVEVEVPPLLRRRPHGAALLHIPGGRFRAQGNCDAGC